MSHFCVQRLLEYNDKGGGSPSKEILSSIRKIFHKHSKCYHTSREKYNMYNRIYDAIEKKMEGNEKYGQDV